MAKVLVTTEGTEEGMAAIRRALDLLGGAHEYVFLTVARPPMPVSGIGGGADPGTMAILPDPEAMRELTDEAEAEAQAGLDRTLADLDLNCRRRVEVGEPAATICEVAADEGADLIVVGTHNAGVIRRLLGGSVSDQVAHHAPCPVLISRPVERPPG